MNKPYKTILSALFTIAIFSVSATNSAQANESKEKEIQELKLFNSAKISLIDAIKVAEQKTGGKAMEAGSRYFCERFFRASCSKNQQKTTRPPMPSAAPIRPRHLVSTQQGVET